MADAQGSNGDQQQEADDLSLEDVVDTIANGVQKVVAVFEKNNVPIVLLSFGVVFGGAAILGRTLSQRIWATPEFFGVLGLGALILLLGCLERLMLLRSRNGNVVMTVDAVNLLLERFPSLLQRPLPSGDEPTKQIGSSGNPTEA